MINSKKSIRHFEMLTLVFQEGEYQVQASFALFGVNLVRPLFMRSLDFCSIVSSHLDPLSVDTLPRQQLMVVIKMCSNCRRCIQ